jgi:alpha-mannosidase
MAHNTIMKISSQLKCICYFLSSFVLASTSTAQQKRIYIANDDHTDYLWSADENTYRNVFLNMLDFYVRKADSTISNGLPTEHQSRFNCDGNIWLWTYEQHRTKAELEKLIARIRSGHISVPFNALVSCYGGTPAEAVLRGMYYAGSLERRFKLDLDLAVAMENQTHPLGLASLWAGAGARYSWKGVCGCTSEFKDSQLAKREHEIYWYTGLDGKRVLLKWYSLKDTIPPGGRDKNESLGGYAEARSPDFAVGLCKNLFRLPGYNRFRVAGAFGYGWDDLATYNSDVFINAAKAGSDPAHKVIVSNEQDFFRDFEATHGASLPSETRTYGNEWDVLCASLAETSAKVKRSLIKLRSAESMAALVAPYNPGFGKTLDSARMNAWMGYGLYWEHDWTTDNLKVISSPQRAAWQRKVEGRINDYANTLFDSALVELGKQIRRDGKRERFFVFNSLSWKRSDYADYKYSGPDNIIVMDVAAKSEVPHQLIVKDSIPYLRIMATDLPSVGYKVFEIRSGKGKKFADAAAVSAGNTIIENNLYRITINQAGAITGLLDKKQSNRECIGKEKANALGSSSETGFIAVENVGPVSVTLKAVSSSPLSHTTRITLYKDVPRIDIDNQITENFTDVRKWKFAFNLNSPETWHEEVGAVLKAKLTTNGGHYSTVNASYKYQTLNHFASVNEADYGVTLSNRDCYFMQIGNSTLDFLDEHSGTLNVLAGGRAVLPGRGIANQDGDRMFNQSFAIGTHTFYSEVAEMQFALAHQNPLVAGRVSGESGNYPPVLFSYLTITDPEVLLWALKPAEEGYERRGIVARLWNFGDGPTNENIVFHTNISESYETSHVETDIIDTPHSGSGFKINIPAKAMNTYRARFDRRD